MTNLFKNWEAETLINWGKGFSSFLTPYPDAQVAQNGVQGGTIASTLPLGENFMKQKLMDTPVLLEADHIFATVIQIWKDLGSVSFWCSAQSFWGRVYKPKVVVHFAIAKLVLIYPPTILWY